jgi:tripartite-type tricarboxylate transporter receptor subunit TctC
MRQGSFRTRSKRTDLRRCSCGVFYEEQRGNILKNIIAALLLATLAHIAVAADDFPNRSIFMINPGPAGGAIDNVARVIAEAMATKLKTNIVTLNVDGAGGILATSKAAHATPDGYTLLFHHIGVATAPALYEKLPYDTLKDLVPIGLVSEVPMVLVARNDLPPKSVPELVTYMKAQGSRLSFGTTGPGNVADLCASVLLSQLGVDATRIPYRGAPPALLDMASGRIDLMCDQTSTSAAQIRAKTVKAYGVATKERLAILPDVPTLIEAGLNFEFSIWQGIYAPAGTPQIAIDKLSSALLAAVQSESVKQKLALLGVTTVAAIRATPAAHRLWLDQELKHWADVYKSTPKQ